MIGYTSWLCPLFGLFIAVFAGSIPFAKGGKWHIPESVVLIAAGVALVLSLQDWIYEGLSMGNGILTMILAVFGSAAAVLLALGTEMLIRHLAKRKSAGEVSIKQARKHGRTKAVQIKKEK